ncbi:uncharacterized protein FIBRA_06227 [Fibroporia radiculosa]|uniref:Uncharacterized protein n=1 Tax=Fibroporia radiculosa TaxID=599839 RepID=J4GAV1_9APHY|nr:uncharacterized protein FIBRA_06227 [Fibroporia radiculosa]CCM04068.1 predicted protein [Fibroporia radiculosa]
MSGGESPVEYLAKEPTDERPQVLILQRGGPDPGTR